MASLRAHDFAGIFPLWEFYCYVVIFRSVVDLGCVFIQIIQVWLACFCLGSFALHFELGSVANSQVFFTVSNYWRSGYHPAVSVVCQLFLLFLTSRRLQAGIQLFFYLPYARRNNLVSHV